MTSGESLRAHRPPARAAGLADETFAGPGEMRERCRRLDWGSTALGAVEGWPRSLRTAVGIALGSAFPSILVWGPERVQLYNDAYVPLIGSKHPDALGRSTHESWPELRDRQETIFARVWSGESVHLVDTPYRLDRRADGGTEEAFFTASFVPVLDDEGEVGGSLSILFETTEQVRARGLALENARLDAAEREARESAAAADAYLRRVIEQAPVVVNTFRGPEHVFTSANAAFREVTGITGPIIGRPVREVQPDLEGTGIFELLDRVYATGEPFHGTGVPVPIDRDGDGVPETYWFDFGYQPVLGDDGGVIGIISVASEVTHLMRAKLDAERHAAELEAVIENIPDGIFIGTAEGITRVNRRGLDQLGLPNVEAMRAPVPSLHRRSVVRDARTGEPFPPGESAFERALRGESVVTDILVRDERTGEDRVMRAATSPVVVDGRITGAIAVNSDVTAQRRSEEALRQAMAEAERANRAKSEFLAVMSHELRTPLNAIGGYAEILAMGIRGPVTEEQRDDLDRIQRSQRHLLGLINEVLNYAKIETGAVRYRLESVVVANAVRAAESLVVPQARARDVALVVADCPPDLRMRADDEKLRQILVNLLSNAVKFTGAGGRVEVSAAADDDASAVRITVRDTGIGIPADKLEAVFEPFVQVNAGLTRSTDGAGLGLAISRDLARGMGGELTAESEVGVGSAFTLVMPRG